MSPGLHIAMHEAVATQLWNDDPPEMWPLAASLVLFQDGVVHDFLRLRGPLLPDDEHNLVSQWALVERSVHEVVAVTRGTGLTMRDVRTGDVHEVRERLGSTQAAVGDLVYAHVVPDGVSHQLVGGVLLVPLQLMDPLIALLDSRAGAVEVADLVAAARRPPEVFTMEGEPMVACEARYRMDDPGAAAALDAVLEKDDDRRWSESVEVDGRTWIRGTVVAEGAELVVSANSEKRFTRLQEVVEGAVPGLELVSESVTPAAERLARAQSSPPPSMTEPLPPEAADALAAFVREQEQRWMDEPVPALGGLSPRQAAADPTRREKLVGLLHEFDRHPPPSGGATFDTGRLRAILGLDERQPALGPGPHLVYENGREFGPRGLTSRPSPYTKPGAAGRSGCSGCWSTQSDRDYRSTALDGEHSWGFMCSPASCGRDNPGVQR